MFFPPSPTYVFYIMKALKYVNVSANVVFNVYKDVAKLGLLHSENGGGLCTNMIFEDVLYCCIIFNFNQT